MTDIKYFVFIIHTKTLSLNKQLGFDQDFDKAQCFADGFNLGGNYDLSSPWIAIVAETLAEALSDYQE